jgi:hypothetical protein
MLIAAVHLAALRLDCLSSLAVAITDTLERSHEMANPAESARRAADLARIAHDELKSTVAELLAVEDAAGSRLALASPKPPGNWTI